MKIEVRLSERSPVRSLQVPYPKDFRGQRRGHPEIFTSIGITTEPLFLTEDEIKVVNTFIKDNYGRLPSQQRPRLVHTGASLLDSDDPVYKMSRAELLGMLNRMRQNNLVSAEEYLNLIKMPDRSIALTIREKGERGVGRPLLPGAQ